MNKMDIERELDKSLDRFTQEINFILETSDFTESQKENLLLMMKHVFYTFSDFKNVIKRLG
ncbi:hypothetical protein JV16_01590 [Anoxybacillus ayderensis]|uniref:Uncharacterized protein n=1 Tax=Anoxybacillus ayderensis TaxID=265546 RepID=A0A0D0GZ00_9BACL|nr:hypothetical protein [Anoxybacillus ayderensis]KIP21096.1 hypothetical protein JV16_01590 [Anoxybacillus ayderensis]